MELSKEEEKAKAKKKEIEELKMEIKNYKEIIEQAIKELDELEASNETKSEEIKKLNDYIETMTEQKSDYEVRLQDMKNDHVTIVEDLKNKIIYLENKEQEIVEKVIEDETKIKSIKETLEEKEKEIKARDAEIKARDMAVERLSKRFGLVHAPTDNIENTEKVIVEDTVENIVEDTVENTEKVIVEDTVENTEKVIVEDTVENMLSSKMVLDKKTYSSDRTVYNELNKSNEPTPAGFGSKFPENPSFKQIFTLTSVYPHRVCQWNGNAWINKNEELSSTHMTDEYMENLIQKIKNNDINLDDLKENEQIELENYLTKHKK